MSPLFSSHACQKQLIVQLNEGEREGKFNSFYAG